MEAKMNKLTQNFGGFKAALIHNDLDIVSNLLLDLKAKLVYLELVSDVGLFALLWSVSPFGGVLPLE
ncbi:hypothetical protein ACLB2K_037852 [Fragaria x ananassa]